MKPKLPLLAVMSCAVLAVTALLGATDTAHADFNPTYEVTIVDPQGGANSDWSLDFSVPKGDVQLGPSVFFIPPEWGITRGDEIPIGAVVSRLRAQATLGIINGACNNVLPVEFIMLNASIDLSDTVFYLDDDANGDPDYFEDKDGNGLQDGIERYPDFITRVLVDEDGNPHQPLARAAGITIVAGVEVLLQFLVFEPGTFIDEEIPNDATLGYPTVLLLQNAGDPETDPIPGAITDFCSPLSTVITNLGVTEDNGCTDAAAERLDPLCDVSSVVIPEGATEPDESGFPIFRNPPEGTYTFTVLSSGQRDADGDGIENGLDTCPFDINEGDPRIGGDGDLDQDGLDAACDPNDNETNSDEDLDGFLNRQDNCPLVANGELEEEIPGVGINRDTDNDAIGDACDPNPDNADTEGELDFSVITQEVSIGPGGPPSEETPAGGGATGDEEDDDGGLGTGAVIGIIIGVIAAVVVVGGGIFLALRRGSPGGGGI